MFISDICLDNKIDGNHHLGHIMLECFKKRKPSDICQVDAATGEEESYGSVLNRFVRLAQSLRRAGLLPGDVLTLSGRNHLDLMIPFYASMMCGLPLATLGPDFKHDDTRDALAILQPKISFCDYENYEYYEQAVKELGLDTKIVTFHGGECSMSCFVAKNYENETEEFRPSYFDTDKVYTRMRNTSGTTGGKKFAALTHAAVVARTKFILIMCGNLRPINIGEKTYVEMHGIDWSTPSLTAVVCPLMNVRRVQSSKMTEDSYADMINKYKPNWLITNPTIFYHVLRQECDLTSLDIIHWMGLPFSKKMLLQLKSRVRENTKILEVFGQIEAGAVFVAIGSEPAGSCGVRSCLNESKLMDITTGTEVTEPHTYGELWVRGPVCFSEYYNNPEETLQIITKDGWVKTGDLLYYDEYGYHYYVERLKKIIRCPRFSELIFPSELEEVIQSHPGVLEVCVISTFHPEYAETPLACVVRAPGSDVTAQEIKDLVADRLSEAKQLRGGLVFLESLPKTCSGKIARAKLQDSVWDMKRE